MVGEPLSRVSYPQMQKIEIDLGMDVGAFVEDSLKHFYGEHLARGYKLCRCSSCQRMLRPILIKEGRQSHEYEQLHKHYLDMILASSETLRAL
jgi:hypothetical protein